MTTVSFIVVQETEEQHAAIGWAGRLCHRVVMQEPGQPDRVISRHTGKASAHREARRLAKASPEEQARALLGVP